MTWFKLLKAVRTLKAPITSVKLAEKVDLEVSVASAWLAKFTRWGYLLRGPATRGSVRWLRTYTLTRWGLRVDPKA